MIFSGGFIKPFDHFNCCVHLLGHDMINNDNGNALINNGIEYKI